MNIYNSLGSNYDLHYVIKSLLRKDAGGVVALQNYLEEKYKGNAILFYKGRQAITSALKKLNLPEDSKIAINGFTCVAVFNAVREAGLEPACIDLEETGGLNFTTKNLKKALEKDKTIRVVIIQNTLGYPCEIKEIERLCKEYKLILIEDLAHCIGTKYEDGREAGTVGDMTVLSFSQDKVVDSVSGGALIDRMTNVKFQISNDKYQKLHNKGNPTFQDKYYPLLTWFIRKTFPFGLGKIIHKVLKILGFLSNPMKVKKNQTITDWHAALALEEFRLLEKNLSHRKKIAGIYLEVLSEKMLMYSPGKTQKEVQLSANLRFPIFVKNRKKIVAQLKKSGAYLSDIWYTDVEPECPNAVADSKIILNLPTHINVTEKDAYTIAEIVNLWEK